MDAKRSIVDRNDILIGAKSKLEISHPRDIYRVSAAWVINPLGQVLLARRSLADTNEAGKWGPSVAGTVEQDESYEDNIRKELREEIGLHDTELHVGPKEFVDGQRRYFVQWYYTLCDKTAEDFELQHEEVTAVRWLSLSQLTEKFAQCPGQFIANFCQSLAVAKILYEMHKRLDER